MEDWKKGLLGGVVPKRNQEKVPRSGLLREPLESEGAVMYAFCRGCGLRYELKPDEAAALFSKIEEPYKIRPGWYFDLGACGVCKSENQSILLVEAKQY